MKILVCGGRDFNDRDAVFKALDRAHAHKPITLLIAGGAPGADTLAEEWADSRMIPKKIVHADWTTYGKSAGPRRNREMLSLNPDGVIAFPGGPGTANMLRISSAASVKIWKPYPRH